MTPGLPSDQEAHLYMPIRRRTVCVLAALCAPLGALAVTATAQATPPPAPPTISSIAIGSSHLTTNGSDSFYTNDPIDSGTGRTTDSFTVNVSGDSNASSIDLLYENQSIDLSQTPDVNGDATFTIPSLPPSSVGDGVFVSQTVAGQTSDSTLDYVFVDNLPSVDDIPVDNIVAADGALGVDTAIPGDPVEVFVDGQQSDGTANSSGFVSGVAGGLTAGYHTAYAETVDGQGQASDPGSSVNFYVAPAPPTISPVPPLGHAAFSNQSEPSISVSGVLAGATVDLYQLDPQTGLLGASLDTVTSVNGGTATVTPPNPVADGLDTFYITQTVSEGTGLNQQLVTSDPNPSLQNNKLDLNVVTAAPSLSTSFHGSSTNDNEPSFFFSIANVFSDIGKVRLIDANTHQTLGEATLQADQWKPTSPLPDGQYTVYGVSIDDAGNVGTAQSNSITFTVDAVAPPAPTVTAPADGATVTTATPTITTSANEPGVTICVYVDGGADDVTPPCQTADGNGNASFTLNAALGDGQHTLTVIADDAFGNDSETATTFTVDTATATPTPPVTTTPAPPTGSSPPVAVVVASATSTPGVIELNAGKSTAAPGTTITSYAWYLGSKLIGHTKSLRYRLSAADAGGETVTLRVTDSAGDTSTAQVKLSAHLRATTVSLSAKTLFAFDSARLTSSAKRLLTKLRPVILASPRVTIDGYTAAGGRQSRAQKSWSTRLSVKRAVAVEKFLFRGHVPAGVQLSVTGRGAARDGAGTTQDRRSTIAYERFVVTINR
jgi:outer membrane protein OmpA-like peptidoglycan-associated protein